MKLIHNVARILIRFNVCDAAVNVQTQRGGIDVAFRDMRLHLHVHGAFLHGFSGASPFIMATASFKSFKYMS